MPIIDVYKKTIDDIVGRQLDIKDTSEMLFKFGMEVDEIEGDTLKIEVTPERVDMMTPEGIARALRAYAGIKKGIPEYKILKSRASVKVDSNLKDIREFSACAIVKNLRWTGTMIKEVMNSHGKIDQTYGRRRKKLGLGVYPLDKIKFPVRYYAEDKNKIKFVPLGFSEPLTVDEIEQKHPKGIENAFIAKGWVRYPLFMDAEGKIMSCLPFVNSREMGQVTEKTKDVFVEVTGTHWKSVNEVLNIVTTSLAERGGQIYSVGMIYGNKTFMTPDLTPTKKKLSVDYVNRIFGLQLSAGQISDLLRRMMYNTKIINRNLIEVTIPAIRTDILHDLDIIDDVGRAYGFDNLKPDPSQIPTIGKLHNYSSFSDKSRMTMIGMGFLEMMNFILTSIEDQFTKMNREPEESVEILNPKAIGINTTRKYLIPEILKGLAYNAHKELPQKVFEVGDVVHLDNSETGASSIRKLAAAIADDKVGYETIVSVLDAYLRTFKVKYAIKKKDHPSFIDGRCGSVMVRGRQVGIIGEIHPQVLNNWNIIRPVAAFELDLDDIFSLKK
jgi:phenylalanyl-tRNA synthetase beta chain